MKLEPRSARWGDDLHAFAAAVGDSGPVTCVGGRTQWDLGGEIVGRAAEVQAPSGLVEFEPAEMIARVGAATPVTELHEAISEANQFTILPEIPGATVGGVLAIGHSDHHRLGHGPLRDALLEAIIADHSGILVAGGGPVVKNVTGFDLCRLLVGSVGTLGFMGEIVVRTLPQPETTRWLAGPADPQPLHAQLLTATSVLWDGTTTWVGLAGRQPDVDAESRLAAGAGLATVEGPPVLPRHRWSVDPASISTLTGQFVAEVGVGVLHRPDPQPSRPVGPQVELINKRIKTLFDPEGRLNPGRKVLG
ncbi:MAG: FAD-binding protein [Actinomycetia bacterium]|nr:FAD-binding protein [Actinomycetes bacterium]MCP4085478.1 FAD-binding protein [Actinomycetes bacterium]